VFTFLHRHRNDYDDVWMNSIALTYGWAESILRGGRQPFAEK
jgi:hypothetical protein